MRAENEHLRAEKIEDVKIIYGQAAELAERRPEVFQLRQELQLLRFEVAQSRLEVNSVKNTVKFNVSRKSYWDVDRAARSLKRKKSRRLFYFHSPNATIKIFVREFLANR